MPEKKTRPKVENFYAWKDFMTTQEQTRPEILEKETK